MAEMWDSVAGAWEANADVVDAQLGAATEAMLDGVRAGPGDAVLDLACGAGSAGLMAARRVGAEGRVVLSDIAPGMVQAAARRAGGLPQVSTLVSDLEAIDAPDGSYDAVVCRLGLMFGGDRVAAVGEALRVLRPGGRYGAMTWSARSANPWLGRLLDAVGEQFGVPFPPPGVANPFSLDDADALARVLRDAGLQDVEVQEVDATYRDSSLDAWWTHVPQLAGPLAQALAGMDPEVRDAIRDRALAHGAAAAREAPGGDIELGGVVLVATGRRPG